MLEAGVLIVGIAYLVATLHGRHPVHARSIRASGTQGLNERCASPVAVEMPTQAKAARRERLRQLLRSKTFLAGVVIVGFWVFWAFAGTSLTPHDPLDQTADVLVPPSSAHWFGTDSLGRDVLSRVLAGATEVLKIAPLAMLLGIRRRHRARADHRVFPRLRRRGREPRHRRRARAAAHRHRGHGARRAELRRPARSSSSSASSSRRSSRARCARRCSRSAASTTCRLRACAARRAPYVMFVEILPNVMGPIVVEATVRLGYAIFAVAGLTFLGFGVQPPSPDWSLQICRQLHASRRRLLLVDGALPGARDRVADRRRQPDRGRPDAGARPVSEPSAAPALDVRNLDVAYRVRGRDRAGARRRLVQRSSAARSYGLVGESGCGKSTAALAIVQYLPRNGSVTSGSIEIAGRDVVRVEPERAAQAPRERRSRWSTRTRRPR